VLAEIIKVCVDRGDAGLLKRVLAYFGYPALPSRLSDEGRVARTAVALAGLGWAFLRWRTESKPDQMKEVCKVLLDAFSGRDLWTSYVWASDSSATGRPWDRWEISRALPLQFQLMQFESYLAAATVVVGARKGLLLPDGDTSEGNADWASALLNALGNANDLATELELSPGGWRESMEAALKAFLDRRRALDQQILLASPLEQDRIQSFAEGLTEALSSAEDRLSSVMVAADPGTIVAKGTKLYINRLVPRDFFVSSSRVFADPEDLGRNIGSGMIAGENAYLVRGP
jgi:hypothetical protein